MANEFKLVLGISEMEKILVNKNPDEVYRFVCARKLNNLDYYICADKTGASYYLHVEALEPIPGFPRDEGNSYTQCP